MLDSTNASDFEAVRNHTAEMIQDAAKKEEPVLIEAPPGSGKTTNAIKLALEEERPITYLASRIDLYEQAEEWCEEQEDISYERIPAPQRDCPTFRGENDGSVSAVNRLYAKGYSGREIHLRFPNLTPCGTSCEYYQKVDRIDNEIGSIDFLIGHHTHCNRHQYVRNRVVIIDEFNAEPFLTPFPDEASDAIDDPGEIISAFLKAVGDHDDAFPTDEYQDVTDLLQNRDSSSGWAAAVDWFRNHGAGRYDAQRFGFLEPSAEEYNKTHAYAPFLTFSLLCMEKIGPGIGVAPPPGGTLDGVWENANLGKATKCLRNRNTGTMYSLQPPDLTDAAQVIGLDGTPTIELWNLLFAPETGFDHQQVISRDDFVAYLESSMNMSLVQMGGGMHPYAGGRVSELDEQRFATVQARTSDQFALISTKKALERYKEWGWLDLFVRRAEDTEDPDEDSSRLFEEYQALNYGMIKSSNEFEKEALGVVAGMPFPNDDQVKIWAGLCGQAVEVSENGGDDGERSLGEFGDRIYRHFAHHQVVQAVLRFGRDDSVYENEGATVYVSTEALPKWFEVDTELEIRTKAKESAVIAKLFETSRSADRPALASETVSTLHEKIDEDEVFPAASKKGVRNALERLSATDHVTVREDAGENGADLYTWDGEGRVIQTSDEEYLLFAGNQVYVLEFGDDWQF